jgi:hypothetical protein
LNPFLPLSSSVSRYESARYRKCFVGGWYQTGDLARRDADGYFWFIGRADDIINRGGGSVGSGSDGGIGLGHVEGHRVFKKINLKSSEIAFDKK